MHVARVVYCRNTLPPIPVQTAPLLLTAHRLPGPSFFFSGMRVLAPTCSYISASLSCPNVFLQLHISSQLRAKLSFRSRSYIAYAYPVIWSHELQNPVDVPASALGIGTERRVKKFFDTNRAIRGEAGAIALL